MKHYLKYHYYTKDGTTLTRIIEIPSRDISEQTFPTTNVFSIEVFDSENLPEEFSNYCGRDIFDKRFYSKVSNIQRYAVGDYLPFEKYPLGKHDNVRSEIISGKKWGQTGYCIQGERKTMIGPETKVIPASSIKLVTEQA